jgi:hypothetical protein
MEEYDQFHYAAFTYLLYETIVLNEIRREIETSFEILHHVMGVGEEGWVRNEDDKGIVAFFKQRNEVGLAGTEPAEERRDIIDHWP